MSRSRRIERNKQSELAVGASVPKRFEHCFAAVFADKNFSDELVVRTIPCFMSRRSAARPTEQDRFKTTFHGKAVVMQTRISERVREI